MSQILILVALLITSLMAPMFSILSNAPAIPDQPVLVLAWPGQDAGRLIVAAGGQEVLGAAHWFGQLAMLSPDALAALQEATGVMGIFDAASLAQICGRET